MDLLFTLWRLLLLLCTFAFPQLLGVLFYFRLRRAPGWVALIAATLMPAVVFCLLAPIFLFAGLREAYAKGEVTCGMPALGAFFFLFAGTISQVFVSLIVQVVLFQRRRRTSNSDARFHSRLTTQ